MAKPALLISMDQAGGTIGRGLKVGIGGTLAITLPEKIEMKITRRGNGDASQHVAGKVIGVEARGEGIFLMNS